MSSDVRILLVEDDEKISNALADYFNANGYQTHQLTNGADAVSYIRQFPVDILILDLMLPGLDGLEVCRTVRAFSQLPIIMLTARVEEIDRVVGLELGADDYVCKPFSPREVIARIKVQLKKSGRFSDPSSNTAVTVKRERMQIIIGGVSLALTPVEFRLLAGLAAYPGRVFSRQQLLDIAHEDQRCISDRTIDSHIRNIRQKLQNCLPGSDFLHSIYGIGYKFEMP